MYILDLFSLASIQNVYEMGGFDLVKICIDNALTDMKISQESLLVTMDEIEKELSFLLNI